MICVDASVGAKWVLEEPWTDKADALAAHAERTSSTLVAGPLFPMEVGNVIRQQMRRFMMPPSESEARFADFLAYPVVLLSVDQLHLEALRTCVAYTLPTMYDAYYVVLAQRHGCDFWTDDQRLLNTLNGRLPFVRWIGSFAEPTDDD